MGIGISTACFYPLETQKSFLKVVNTGAKCAEIFFNSPSEIEIGFLEKIKSVQTEYGINIDTVHPYLSATETYFLFGNYPRRFNDILSEYRRFFRACNFLGAKYLIIHGCKEPFPISDEEYFERFKKLVDIGKEYGVLPVQENVHRSKAQRPDFIKKLKEYLGEDFKMVLDIKQAYRSGEDAFEFIKLFGEDIVRVHISDNDLMHDCLPPGEGSFDTDRLFKILNEKNFTGDYIIELYSHNYKSDEQILNAKKFLEGKLTK